MTYSSNFLVVWLSDYFLLSTILLALVVTGNAFIKQPAIRTTITKATLVGLLLLATLCALPRWSVIHLMTTADKTPAAPQAVASSFQIPTTPTTTDNTDATAKQYAAPVITPVATATEDSRWEAAAFNGSIFLSVAFIVGMASVTTWLIIGHIAAQRLRRSATPAPTELTAVLTATASRRDATTWPRLSDQRFAVAKTRKTIELLHTDAIDVAVALGIRWPAILLPTDWLQSFPLPIREGQEEGPPSMPDLRSVLAHEFAHIRNHDLLWLAVSRALLTILWAHPLFWALRRRLRLDQELLADASAADLTSRQQYAQQLLAWARGLNNSSPLRPISAVGLWEGPSQLCRRIEILIDEKLMIVRQCPRRWGIAATTLAIAATLALSAVTIQPQRPAIAQEPTATVQVAAEPLVDAKQTKPPAKESQQTPNTVAGQALNSKREPVAAAEVFMFRWDSRDSSHKLIDQTKTSDDGRFQFDNVIDIEKEFPNKKFPSAKLIAGGQFIQCIVRASGLVPFETKATPEQVAQQGIYRAAVMPPGNTLTGRITGPDGKPIAGALVMVGSTFGDWEGIKSARTDADGNYKIADLNTFNLDVHRNQIEEMQTSGKATGLLASTEYLTVESTGFATRQENLAKVPGQQDVQLELPAVLEGRVVFADSGNPASGIVVQAAMAITAKNAALYSSGRVIPMKASTRTDQDGKYRFTTLPPGTYSIWSDVPDRVTNGVLATDAASDRTTQLTDLILTHGGIVSARIVDAETGKRIALEDEMRAMLIADSRSVAPSRAQTNNAAEANPHGRFDLRVPAGKQSFIVGFVFSRDGTPRWTGRRQYEVDVVDGQTVEVDVPVEKYEPAPVTANYATAVFKPTEAEEKDGNSESKDSERPPPSSPTTTTNPTAKNPTAAAAS